MQDKKWIHLRQYFEQLTDLSGQKFMCKNWRQNIEYNPKFKL